MPDRDPMYSPTAEECISARMRSSPICVERNPWSRRWFSVAATALALALLCATAAKAQTSLRSAVDLALRNNPRVKSGQDEVKRAQAQLSETHDIFVPSVSMGASLGQAYGYLPYPPTLFQVNAGSLVYSASQIFYIRSARAGLNAAKLSLQDVCDTVAQDTALAFLTLQHDEQREQVLRQQAEYANKLVSIVQDRLNAGQDTQMDLTQAKLTAANLRLGDMRAQDDIVNDRDHLARLMGIPTDTVHIDLAFPEVSANLLAAPGSADTYMSPAVQSAFANATAKEQQALGDAKIRFRPQVNLVVNYSRYATFTNSFKTLEDLNANNAGPRITADEAAFGVQINLPFFDKARADHANASAAEAAKAMHDAQNAKNDALDGRSKLGRSIAELQTQAEVASLQQQLAQQQLDVLRLQLQSGTGNPSAPQMTPKDEQNSLIAERDKYLGLIDANYQLHQAEVQLLRQTGQLESWITSTGNAPPNGNTPNNVPSAPTPQH